MSKVIKDCSFRDENGKCGNERCVTVLSFLNMKVGKNCPFNPTYFSRACRCFGGKDNE